MTPNIRTPALSKHNQKRLEGTPFGRYRLVELLGSGGMGEVWRAYDTATDNRTVAIKLLPPQLAADRTFVARFQPEAEAADDPSATSLAGYFSSVYWAQSR